MGVHVFTRLFSLVQKSAFEKVRGEGAGQQKFKVLPTNNQIYLTLPPWFLLGMHNSIVHAIHRPALEFLLACGVLWGSVGREILTTT